MTPFGTGIGHLAWVQFWQVTALALGVGLASRLFCRRRPHLAYVLWMLVLLKSLTPPIWASPTGVFSWAAWAFPPSTTLEITAGASADQDRTSLLYGPGPGGLATDERSANAGSVPPATPAAIRPESLRAAVVLPWSRVTTALGLLWLLGAAVCAALMTISTLRLRRTILCSRSPVDASLATKTDDLRRALQVNRPVRLIVVPRSLGPLAFGWLRPTIVLPQMLVSSSTPQEIEPLVAHELVHVRRRDSLAALLQTVVQCLWWFHPLVWWANRRIVEERERCCDEAVIAALGFQPGRYARSLLAVLEWKSQARWPASVPGVRAFEVNKRRLEHLMRHPGRFQSAMPRRDWLFLLAGLVLVIPGAGPSRLAGGSNTSTKASLPSIKLEPAQNVERGLQTAAVELTDQPATAQPVADDGNPPADTLIATKESPKGLEIEIYAMKADGTNARRVAAIPDYPIINSPEISPDGQWVAVDGWKWDQDLHDAHLLIVNLETGRVRNLGLGAMPTWSRNGRWIAYSKYGPEGGVFLREVDGDFEQLIDRNGWGIQWSPDGLKLAYTRQGNLIVYDLRTNDAREIFPPGATPYNFIFWNCKWSPDSTRICFKGQRHDGKIDIAIVAAVGDRPNLRVRCDGQLYNEDIAWHPDGSRVTVPRQPAPDQPGQIYEFDPDGEKPPVLLAGQPADRNNAGMCFSRDGKTFIFVSYK